MSTAASASREHAAAGPTHKTRITPWAEVGAVARSGLTWSVPTTGAGAGRPAHHGENGCFRNPWPSYKEYGPTDFLFGALPELRKVDTYALPTVTPAWAEIASPSEALQATWCGHACALVQAHGFNILTDPVFSDRASPVQWAGPKRFTPPPCGIADLPPVHMVLLSHNHYDHIDSGSVRALLRKEVDALRDDSVSISGARESPPGPYSARPFMGTQWIVPLGVKPLLVSLGVRGDRVVELDWWDAYCPAVVPAGGSGSVGSSPASSRRGLNPLAAAGAYHRRDGTAPLTPLTDSSRISDDAVLSVVAVPAQHQSARNAWDRNRSLWAGFVVVAEAEPAAAAAAVKSDASTAPPAAPVRFYFSGDTGYRSVPRETTAPSPSAPAAAPACPAFSEIGRALGPFDLSFLPIGAYSPRWFMSSFHANPDDAVEMHVDVRSKRSIGMHWGAFMLTDEPVEEPPEALRTAAVRANLGTDEFVAVVAGTLIRAGAGPLNPDCTVVRGPSPAHAAAIAKAPAKGWFSMLFK